MDPADQANGRFRYRAANAPALPCSRSRRKERNVARPLLRFEKLKVYQRARELTRYLHEITNALPDNLADVQETLRRHRTIVVIKIARGTGEPTRREAVATFRSAARSAELCESMVARLRLANIAAPWLEEAEKLAGELHSALADIACNIQRGARARDVFRNV
jgi:hypothetical protein